MLLCTNVQTHQWAVMAAIACCLNLHILMSSVTIAISIVNIIHAGGEWSSKHPFLNLISELCYINGFLLFRHNSNRKQNNNRTIQYQYEGAIQHITIRVDKITQQKPEIPITRRN